MALQKRSRLHKLLLTFDENGKYITGETLFQEGAWDDEAADWEGVPVEREYMLGNIDAASRKFLGDVISVAAVKALETADVAATALKKAKETCEKLAHEHAQIDADLKNALGARDNFAKLHKEAKGELIARGNAHSAVCDENGVLRHKLEKIPRLIRSMFGAI